MRAVESKKKQRGGEENQETSSLTPFLTAASFHLLLQPLNSLKGAFVFDFFRIRRHDEIYRDR